MFPLASTESIFDGDLTVLTQAYHDVVIYDGPDPDDVLYEGPIVVHANGWIELEGNRLLSPSAIHHIDVFDDAELSGDGTPPRGGRRDDDGSDDPGGSRTSKFSPR
ncbi:hypothetical protein [Natrarchaeobaculum aegyptiacum]|uniref:Uncharacterized protein n=1 Tax=Natrarchaeobaculum aegyptiacum TaxID=745377 RepID=A0A2Z2HNL5_9EURY|nr:hypothetical protein [Natrarchaeobaculum aegyptiacum]ARS88519.1 hypothetical protein B1756_01280 [Natrarchaeobaculum aegyptiacum]